MRKLFEHIDNNNDYDLYDNMVRSMQNSLNKFIENKIKFLIKFTNDELAEVNRLYNDYNIKYKVKYTSHLRIIIQCMIKENIEKYPNLNWLDTSEITNLSYMFYMSEYDLSHMDVSLWDVSKVTNFSCMFANCNFNGDISCWNVSSGKYFLYMFANCNFNRDISNWNINEKNIKEMFNK